MQETVIKNTVRFRTLGFVDELEAYFVGQTAMDEGREPAERIEHTFKGTFPSGSSRLIHPEGPGLLRPRQGKSGSTMHRIACASFILS
ncbi:hypothetical protein [Roseibium sediminis]|uniref:hypothetical protein n=1 Tax=Roseibium sediminis TaxID=1775174 RepID=UPI00123DAEB2|nr:hypothetical protein [Roseibium sediminis]